eukprot:7104237-Pyramimonas_sp.AAC.1
MRVPPQESNRGPTPIRKIIEVCLLAARPVQVQGRGRGRGQATHPPASRLDICHPPSQHISNTRASAYC